MLYWSTHLSYVYNKELYMDINGKCKMILGSISIPRQIRIVDG